jgi:MFS family permease
VLIPVQTGAINYYAPTIFKGLGLSSTTTSLFAQGIYGVVKVVTCLIFVFFLADSLGRRLSLMWSGAVQGFAMFFVGFASPIVLDFRVHSNEFL